MLAAAVAVTAMHAASAETHVTCLLSSNEGHTALLSVALCSTQLHGASKLSSGTASQKTAVDCVAMQLDSLQTEKRTKHPSPTAVSIRQLLAVCIARNHQYSGTSEHAADCAELRHAFCHAVPPVADGSITTGCAPLAGCYRQHAPVPCSCKCCLTLQLLWLPCSAAPGVEGQQELQGSAVP